MFQLSNTATALYYNSQDVSLNCSFHWGDIKTKLLPDIGYSIEAHTYYRKQSDLLLDLEYSKTYWNLDQPLCWKEGFYIAQPLDNVLIEEYEKGLIFKKRFHRILQIERNGSIIFKEDQN